MIKSRKWFTYQQDRNVLLTTFSFLVLFGGRCTLHDYLWKGTPHIIQLYDACEYPIRTRVLLSFVCYKR